MITFKEYCKTIKEDWGTTSPIPKETYKPVDWKGNFLWIDLGLPSGTLWADVNLYNPDNTDGFWTYDEIMASPYKDYVPTKEQMEELVSGATWKWNSDKKGYDITGTNGKRIFLPAEGYGIGKNRNKIVGKNGGYWTNEREGSTDDVFSLDFDDVCHSILRFSRGLAFSVRPVKK